MDNEHYAPWEWQPIERMPHGCSEVHIRTTSEKVEYMCSCDYWWLSDERKLTFVSFRYD